MRLTPQQSEIRLLLNEADTITKQNHVSKSNDARLSYILARVKALQSGTLSEASTELRDFGRQLFEHRAASPMQAGTQSITYSSPTEGGTLVPTEFHKDLVLGMATFDPLLDENVCTVIPSGDGSLRPMQVPAWDLSTFAAVKVGETVQQVGQVPPTAASTLLNSFKYKASLPVSIELEQDAYQPMLSFMQTAYAIGFARGIGADLVLGDGVTGPQGVLTGAADSGVITASATSLVLNDFENVYFGLNRWHRAAPKCAWLLNDTVYQMARKATDAVGNPLLKLERDQEVIMGKPVYVCPSLPEYNASLAEQAAGSFCVFGNLAHYLVRVSQLSIRRNWQLPNYVENGLALYTGLMRCDAKVLDPTAGSVPPIVSARLHE